MSVPSKIRVTKTGYCKNPAAHRMLRTLRYQNCSLGCQNET